MQTSPRNDCVLGSAFTLAYSCAQRLLTFRRMSPRLRLIHPWTALALLALGSAARAEEPMWVDARVSTYAQYFQQALVPGLPGAVARVEPSFPLTVSAFLRVGAIDLPNAPDAVSAEVSAWGSLGPRDGRSVDGDVTAAWAQYKRGQVRVKLGRQVTLPGSSRFVRFDGAAIGVSVGVLDIDGYAGWVALPRWNLARGATLLGFVGDGLKDPLLMEAQNRAGQVTAGLRLGLRLPASSRIAVAFHEQHDLTGPAFRVLSADVGTQPLSWLGAGARASLDLQALAISEARVWVDVSALKNVPLAVDYSYQSPSLLLPQTSVLAAFGGAAWHEVGGEVTVRALQSLKVTGRASGQVFELTTQPGARGQLRAVWTPGIDGRLMILGELARALIPPSGYTQLRAGARYRATATITTSADASAFFYDQPIRGVSSSLTGVGSVEWAAKPWLRAMLSATVMRTPYAAFEAQGLARLVVELDPVSAGGLP